MEFQHSQSTREWQQQVRQFVEQDLIPWEVEAELNNGVIPQEVSDKMQANAIALGLSKMDAPVEHGGLGMSMVNQLAAWEELGRVTNALCWCFPEAQHWMFEACANSEYQIKNYLHPLMDGSLRECYAITEAWHVNGLCLFAALFGFGQCALGGGGNIGFVRHHGFPCADTLDIRRRTRVARIIHQWRPIVKRPVRRLFIY